MVITFLKDGRKPPYSGDELGEDPAHCPQEGFAWRGDGKPGSREGGYSNRTPGDRAKGESLRPDFHTPVHEPHWDYVAPDGKRGRLYTDGTWEWKN